MHSLNLLFRVKLSPIGDETIISCTRYWLSKPTSDSLCHSKVEPIWYHLISRVIYLIGLSQSVGGPKTNQIPSLGYTDDIKRRLCHSFQSKNPLVTDHNLIIICILTHNICHLSNFQPVPPQKYVWHLCGAKALGNGVNDLILLGIQARLFFLAGVMFIHAEVWIMLLVPFLSVKTELIRTTRPNHEAIGLWLSWSQCNKLQLKQFGKSSMMK